MGFVLLAASAAVLLAGAELFAEHAAAAARRLGVTGVALALVLAGAEPEELVVAVMAALEGRPGIAVGDAVGANLTMLTLVLGTAALARPLPVGPRVRRFAVVAAATGAGAAVLVAADWLNPATGVVLVAVYGAVVVTVWRGDGDTTSPEAGPEAEPVPRAVALVLLGVAIMAAGGRLAVDGAERVVESLEVSDTAVGLTLVALATTAELHALAFAAIRRGVSELAVAGVVGSAVSNATVTLGGAALTGALATDGATGAAVAAALGPLVVVALAWRGVLGRGAGAALVAGYGVFLALTLG